MPDRKTVSLPTPIASDLSVAIFSPTRVFPAPGTPVTKQIAFSLLFFDLRMISPNSSQVIVRLVAPASDLDISPTE